MLTARMSAEPWPTLKRSLKKCDTCKSCQPSLLDKKARPLFWTYDGENADVLFVLEAPNVDDTEVGYLTYDLDEDELDDTGKFFLKMYREVLGERMEDLAVTNSVLCLPAKSGKSYPVTSSLRQNCSKHLRAQIESLDPFVVVTLGEKALVATALIDEHGQRTMLDAVGKPRPWFNRTLFPLYHPGKRAQISRRPDAQRRDWEGLLKLLAVIAPQRAARRELNLMTMNPVPDADVHAPSDEVG